MTDQPRLPALYSRRAKHALRRLPDAA